ncbi:unnamed protein product [Periconia digitata]|uniref:Uncharacterized protein n=1 Tax=Periconia digitata TaxID=1303443 RepID=A0A9W4XM29_9PLEO|nr:unnamed protein product [Periconia digitata]
MPSLSWVKSNRSHHSIDTSSGQVSPVPSGNHLHVNDQPPRYTSAPDAQTQQHLSQQQQQQQQQQISPGGYRQQFPERSTSHRHSTNVTLDQQNLHQIQSASGSSYNEAPVRRGSLQPQHYSQEQPPKKAKEGLRSRLGFGKSHKEEEDTPKASKTEKLGRRVSVARKPHDYQAHQQQQQQQQQQQHPDQSRLQPSPWNDSRHGTSNHHLPPSPELNEDQNLDPFLQQDDNPSVPPKDGHFAGHPAQYSQNPPQDQYRPPLARVNTDGTTGSYHAQGGVDQQHPRYSPEHQQQHQQQQQQHLPQQQQQQQNPQLSPNHSQQQQQVPSPPQYQTYHPSAPPQQPGQGEYKAFHLPGQQNPLATNAQLHPPEHPTQPQQHVQQQTYYQYQAQQQAQQLASQSSSHESHPQNTHYSQQGQFSPPLQPHHGQEHSQPHHVRGSSQGKVELNTPLPTPPVEAQHSQQLRPPSSQGHIAPPSPLQTQGVNFTPYDAHQGQQSQNPDPRAQNTTPPQQTQDSMAPATQKHTLRKVNDGSQAQAGPPSRESSLLSQPSTQASQGQPFRGDKQGQQASSGDLGRATPPPRSATDMSEEEISSLVKEHEVLREKYQKVKRYFFEQQTQVHQLQNTLANQRLSVSRTSWDDSEYGTRFQRLDGLIAQLSFAIRKDWKTIPPWLHTVVNKTAVETGKQEMTAVGRAFISCWLVENIFDKYFHPDLEPGLSTQLKAIQLNIRRNAPPAQSPEDEDALVAKVINWRLATLEGLSDMLKANTAAANRATLTEKLNEQLIGSLQMYMNDPAPPDLNGGAYMIIELAISVAQHLPLESREVHIEYFYPGSPLSTEFMKVESGIPALTSPIEQPDDGDRASVRSGVSSVSVVEQEQQAQQAQQQASHNVKEHSKKSSIFGMMSKKPVQTPATLGKQGSALGQGGSQQSLSQPPPSSSGPAKEEAPPSKVRLSVGFAVEIRGKSILAKAPVYST